MSLEKGIELYKSGEFEEALACFNELIQSKSGNAEFHLYRGRILSRLGKAELALEDFEIISSLEPYNTDFISDRAVVLHLLERNEEALSEFDRAVNLDPKNPYRYSSRAFFKDRIGDLIGSIQDYERAIELDPEDAIAYNNKGIVEEKLGYQAKAKKSFGEADKLVGYSPSTSSSADQPIGDFVPNFISEDKAEKMNLDHFLKTLTAVFTDSKARTEFTGFIKSFFSGKKD